MSGRRKKSTRWIVLLTTVGIIVLVAIVFVFDNDAYVRLQSLPRSSKSNYFNNNKNQVILNVNSTNKNNDIDINPIMDMNGIRWKNLFEIGNRFDKNININNKYLDCTTLEKYLKQLYDKNYNESFGNSCNPNKTDINYSE